MLVVLSFLPFHLCVAYIFLNTQAMEDLDFLSLNRYNFAPLWTIGYWPITA